MIGGGGLCSVVDQRASSSMVTAITTTLYDQTWQGWCRHHFSSAIWAVSVTVSFWCLVQLAIGHHLCLCVTYTGPSSASSGVESKMMDSLTSRWMAMPLHIWSTQLFCIISKGAFHSNVLPLSILFLLVVLRITLVASEAVNMEGYCVRVVYIFKDTFT